MLPGRPHEGRGNAAPREMAATPSPSRRARGQDPAYRPAPPSISSTRVAAMTTRRDPSEATRFEGLAGAAIDDLLERHPEVATSSATTGSTTGSPTRARGAGGRTPRRSRAFATRSTSVDPRPLERANRVDAEILRSRLARAAVRARRAARARVEPAGGQPGRGDLPAARARVRARRRTGCARSRAGWPRVPEHLDAVRAALGDMPRVHVETAIGAVRRDRSALITEEIDRVAARRRRRCGREIDAVRPARRRRARGASIAGSSERLEDADARPADRPGAVRPQARVRAGRGEPMPTPSSPAPRRTWSGSRREIAEAAARIAGEPADGARPGAARARPARRGPPRRRHDRGPGEARRSTRRARSRGRTDRHPASTTRSRSS